MRCDTGRKSAINIGMSQVAHMLLLPDSSIRKIATLGIFMTVRKFPLAVCVCLTCATVTPGGHAATSSLGASRADQLAEISRYRDQARWVDALAAIERAQSEQSDDTLLYKLQTLTLSDIGNAWLAWQLCKARPDLFDQDQKAHLESNYPSQAGELESGLWRKRRHPSDRGRRRAGADGAVRAARGPPAGTGTTAHPHGSPDPTQPSGQAFPGARRSQRPATGRPSPPPTMCCRR